MVVLVILAILHWDCRKIEHHHRILGAVFLASDDLVTSEGRQGDSANERCHLVLWICPISTKQLNNRPNLDLFLVHGLATVNTLPFLSSICVYIYKFFWHSQNSLELFHKNIPTALIVMFFFLTTKKIHRAWRASTPKRTWCPIFRRLSTQISCSEKRSFLKNQRSLQGETETRSGFSYLKGMYVNVHKTSVVSMGSFGKFPEFSSWLPSAHCQVTIAPHLTLAIPCHHRWLLAFLKNPWLDESHRWLNPSTSIPGSEF